MAERYTWSFAMISQGSAVERIHTVDHWAPLKGNAPHWWSCSFISLYDIDSQTPLQFFWYTMETRVWVWGASCRKQTLGVSGLPKGDSSSEFSLSEELLWRCWANFLFSASAIRAAGSLRDAAPPLLRLLVTGVPPGDLKKKRWEIRCLRTEN